MISPHVLFYVVLFNLILFFVILKNTNPILKYPVFVKTSKNRKKFENRKKNVFVHMAKCLKAKKSYCVFHTKKKKNNVLACILALITSLLKSREHWPKFQKQQKLYFVCLLVSGVRYYT